jgi:hypothetical protein
MQLITKQLMTGLSLTSSSGKKKSKKFADNFADMKNNCMFELS